MKIAIISDIHSNLEALQACVRKASLIGVEQYICLGDVVGYGSDPSQTLEMVRLLPNLIMVRGNHEEALLSPYIKGLRESIRISLDWARQHLSSEQLDFLSQLPYRYDFNDITLVHATACNPEKWGYVFNVKLAAESMDATDKTLTFIGHTHQPQVYYAMPNKEIKCLTPQTEVPIPIFQSGKYLINVGSVGQPRDEINASCFAVYDSNERVLEFHRVAYDYRLTAKKIIERGLPHVFAERLKTGN